MTMRVVENAGYWHGMVDPFVMSEPCWLLRVLPKLDTFLAHRDPLPTVSHEELRRKDIMAIKMITEQEAPRRLHIRAGASLSQEYFDVVNAIKTLPQGKALVVTLESEPFTKPVGKNDKGKDKPGHEIVFSYSLRRHFKQLGLAAVAYQSGKLEVTVRRMSKEEIAAAQRKAGKKK
jgi:hypothetical protein